MTFSFGSIMPATALLFALTLGNAAANVDPQRLLELQRRLDQGQKLSDDEMNELLAAMPPEEVDVNLVMVPVLVTSRWGRPITDLEEGDFALVAGGVKRPLAFFNRDSQLPLRLAVLLDVSGSMGQPEQRARVRQVLASMAMGLRRGDEMRLLTFASGEVRQQNDWTTHIPNVVARALSIEAGGETAIVDALEEAARMMPEPATSRPAIILITDGIDNASSHTVEQAVQAARSIGTPIYAFGVGGVDRAIQDRAEDEPSPFDALRVVAEQTGGLFFPVIDQPQAQQATLQIASELRSQYWLAFKPDGPSDGRFRPIRVTVDRAGARIRARSGYR